MDTLRSHIVVVESPEDDIPSLLNRVFQACTAAYSEWLSPHSPEYELMHAWVRMHGMGKIGRRGTEADIKKIKSVLPQSIVVDNVLVTPPISRDEQPKVLSRTQLSGWKTSGSGSSVSSGARIEVNAEISTGKAVGAIGHIASSIAARPQLKSCVPPWLPISVGLSSSRNCPLVIRDAGHTEVAPGSTTAQLHVV